MAQISFQHRGDKSNLNVREYIKQYCMNGSSLVRFMFTRNGNLKKGVNVNVNGTIITATISEK